ncbi:MAG: hypothetical protein LW603_06025 [Sediminibacterium sp.]|nr:hypothetical protein [Sediminibacterium sp.]
MKKYIIFGIVLMVAGLLYGVIDLAKAKKEKENLISYNGKSLSQINHR